MRNWTKSIGAMMIIVLILLTSIACESQHKEIVASEKQRIIVDSLGREVVVARDIERIACLFAPVGHMLQMLEEADKIVAVSNGFTRDRFLNMLCPSIGDASLVKGGGHFNIEEMMATNPDIIIMSTDSFDKATTKKLDKLGVPYIIINFANIKEQKGALMLLASLFDKQDIAQSYSDYYDEMIELVESRTKDIVDKRTIYHAINEVARTDKSDTICGEWTGYAGAINVALDNNKDYDYKINDDKLYVSFEQICLWNPDMIIANGEGIDDYIMKSDKFKELRAVKNSNVHLLPVGISRWGHPNSIETPLAIMWTAKKLYPDRFEDISIEDRAREFYSDFYRTEIDDELLEKILSGKGMRRVKGDN